MKRWDSHQLEKDYKTARFKVGEKDDGEKIRMKMVSLSSYLFTRLPCP